MYLTVLHSGKVFALTMNLAYDPPRKKRRISEPLYYDIIFSFISTIKTEKCPKTPSMIVANARGEGIWISEIIREGKEHGVFHGYTKEQVISSKRKFCTAKPETRLKKKLNALSPESTTNWYALDEYLKIIGSSVPPYWALHMFVPNSELKGTLLRKVPSLARTKTHTSVEKQVQGILDFSDRIRRLKTVVHELPDDSDKSSRLAQIKKKYEPDMCKMLTQLYRQQYTTMLVDSLEIVRQNHQGSHAKAFAKVLETSPFGGKYPTTIDDEKVTMYRGNALLVRDLIISVCKHLRIQMTKHTNKNE